MFSKTKVCLHIAGICICIINFDLNCFKSFLLHGYFVVVFFLNEYYSNLICFVSLLIKRRNVGTFGATSRLQTAHC